MVIGIVLVHDKGDTTNKQQVSTLASLLIANTTDPENPYYYLQGDLSQNPVKVCQIIPVDTIPPSNLESIDSITTYFMHDIPKNSTLYTNYGLQRVLNNQGAIVNTAISTLTDITTNNILTKVNIVQAKIG